MRIANSFLACSIAAALTGCTVGPNYIKPDTPTPAQFKAYPGWVVTDTQAAPAQGAWWEIYNDAQLNDLEPRVASANQSLRAAYYAYQQTLALTQAARAAALPTVGATASAARSDSGSATNNNNSFNGRVNNSYSLGLNASWAPDLWGRVQRQVEASSATAAASAADLQAAQLSLQATLAQSYFQIRQLDSQTSLAQDTVSAYEKSLQLTQNRYNAGVVSRADVAQAQTQLANAQVQRNAFGVQRAQLEHAIAVLIGEPASSFSLAPMPGLPLAQTVPTGLPSHLLLRRPDIASAERKVAAANAQIGVAKSAYFPALTLSASGSYRSSAFADLLSAPNLFWSIGPTLAQALFDGGARRAQVAQNEAAYQQTVAQYRQASLVAFQQVEDQLAALSILASQTSLQQDAVRAADDALRLVSNQYKSGTVPYLNVLSAQTAAYSARNSALQTAGQQLVASVALIQALGGNWGVIQN
jgi:NodT family efflux transporter outer membrane factor (OMF) lipoprotein